MITKLLKIFAVGLVATGSAFADGEEGRVRIEQLTGKEAEILLKLKPKKPIVILEDGYGKTVALLLAATAAEIPFILEELLVNSEPPFCDLNRPVACCDPVLGSMVINTVNGLLNYGETCMIPEIIPPPPDEEPIADVSSVPLDAEVEEELVKRFGNLHELLMFPESDGEPRILVRSYTSNTERMNPNKLVYPVGGQLLLFSQDGWVVPASSHCHAICPCNKSGTKSRCHHGNHYWYTSQGGAWCRTPVQCTHAYTCS